MHQRDINARRAGEMKSQQLAAELARSNARLEEFAYTAAHDLREPLRAVSLYTEVLVRDTQMDTRARQTAQFIVDGAARMSTLIDDLLCFAAIGMQEPPRSVDLQDVVAKARQNLAPAIDACGARVTVDRLPVVRSNENHLIRLFQNLMSNAIKYRREESVEIHITSRQHGPDWVIGISDNGVGIALEDQARVFLPFVRMANPDVPGTGLGLAVCKRIVEGLGGAICVESKSGAGSTFSFTIPAAEADTVVPRVSNGISRGIGV